MLDTPQDHVPYAEDPLKHANSESWFRLISDVNPPSILVVIDSWLGFKLRNQVKAEDVWQDTLLEAWRDRENCAWQGVRAFRSWLLTIARRRIYRLAQEQNAEKRGGKVDVITMSILSGDDESPGYAGPIRSTTPSRAARDRETSLILRETLNSLPDDLRVVVRLRLFEDLKVEEVAQRLKLGTSAVRHRFRKGVALYRRRLVALMSREELSDSATPDAKDQPPPDVPGCGL